MIDVVDTGAIVLAWSGVTFVEGYAACTRDWACTGEGAASHLSVQN